jgi:glycosyltransferase involved in cell wall biosynthesis
VDISFILISRAESNLIESVSLLKTLIETEELNAEVIISTGLNPSRQRNESAKIAQGDWLYFLDDDSILDPQSVSQFKLALKIFPHAVVFGGPSLVKNENQNSWQEAIQTVFSSDLGIGPIKSRYLSVGQIRLSNEKELILCNMIIRKEFFLQNKGFNESLYPNEENEFLSRIYQFGQIVYSPLIIVYRNHRNNLQSFFKQMFNYGRGRTKHFLYSKNYADYIYFVPLLLVILALFFILITSKVHLILYLLFIYFALVLPTCAIRFLFSQRVPVFFLSIIAFVICHLGYATGLCLGFFLVRSKRALPIETKVVNFLPV